MTQDVILTLSLVLVAALVARFLASLLRIPEILLLVAVGALFGPSVLDVVDAPLDSIGAELMFTLGVSLILFYGGLNLSLPLLRRVWVGLGMLVVPGVILTALVTGATAYLVFDLSFESALLVGAVLSPTDPAILIPLFVRSRLRPKVAQTIVAESAFNDPTGAALALALAGVLLSGDRGAFLAGLIVGNMEHLGLEMHAEHERVMRAFAFNMADLVTLFVFVVLGANIPWADLGENLAPAVAVLAVLMLVARPLTVLFCTLPDRGGAWTARERVFLCWTRETGVVPAALVGVLAGLGVPHTDVYASVVALAIVMTLLFQALPAGWLARRLGLLERPHAVRPARREAA